MPFNASNYMEYIRSLNNERYNEALDNLGENFYIQEIITARNLMTGMDAINLVRDRLPKSIDKNDLIDKLIIALEADSVEDFTGKVKKLENSYISDSQLNSRDLVILKSFFSTLRYSSSLWGK